jgi:hypothetical protein
MSDPNSLPALPPGFEPETPTTPYQAAAAATGPMVYPLPGRARQGEVAL